MAPASASSPLYAKDEKVLCFHMELLYEAKVLDVKPKEANDKSKGFLYKVHYKGWKGTWDDWVPQERVRKLNEENKELARNLKQDMDAQRRAASGKPASTSHKKRPFGSEVTGSSARGSEERSSAVPQPPRGTKRGREIEGIDKVSFVSSRVYTSRGIVMARDGQRPASTDEPRSKPFDFLDVRQDDLQYALMDLSLIDHHAQEEEYFRRPAVKIFIPDALKSILVDDWEKVTREQKLVPLPAPVSATQFLNEYETFESSQRRPGSADADLLEEVIAGVKEYFNKALGRILLYRFERQQFYEIHREVEQGDGDYEGKTLCDVYGCEHLLRLFVSMPDLIAHTNMDSQAVSRLREEMSKMTQWLAKRIDKYLSTDYEHAGQEYLENAKSS